MTVLKNARIYDYHEYRKDAYLVFDDKIIEIGSMNDFDDSRFPNALDLKNNLVIPGFVAGHTHLYSAFAGS